MKNFFFNSRHHFDGPGAVGLFLFRVLMGYAMALHGLQKIQSDGGFFGWMGPDVPAFLQGLATFSEFFGGLAILFGLLTPLACVGVMSTMFVAILSTIARGNAGLIKGPNVQNAYELPLMYFLFALMIFLTGPGLLSLDAVLAKMLGQRDAATPSP